MSADRQSGDFAPTERLSSVRLGEVRPAARSPEIQQELDVALYDLAEENSFAPTETAGSVGPFALEVALVERRVVLRLADSAGRRVEDIVLPLGPLREIIEDYSEVCARYLDAVRRLPREEIEAIDRDRRALHDDGGRLVCEAIAPHARVDHATARRLFSVITALVAPG